MSDATRTRCACRIDREVPPGTGIGLATLFGLGGLAAAAAVLAGSGSWAWTLLVWQLAAPVSLAVYVAARAMREHLTRRACPDARCACRILDRPARRIVNV